ncbi:PX-associated sorting nexin 13 [Penicillium cf. griseofulvum]|uniref:PX-associated sorting nexin 13 n=1 Tax=Penicillium cf. griseofulvum TaxID=2972120 RepID=A0A9W9IWI9_9EURO|nr:PX-associated sorting nexin 13 [Penicillium cf. griseofulvum]KAJ5429896.1 PX-associated sorting nexin 13 [Penicillium cf. griseofulvum]KAJ5436333.1 PX-associated sorting nexin 13 [Penicillium cf. griseofulvum]
MNDQLRPGLQPISHLKAGPTTSSSRSTALPSATTLQPPSRPSSRLRTQRDSGKDDPDSVSNKATTALIRRVLCPQTSNHGASSPQPPEELLPPLTSSNDVDRQLYALLAIIIKEFVYSWYSKITPDQALVNEVLQVIAHCTRALEQRLRQIDVAQLALDEIPALVESHVLSYRQARQQSHLSGLPTSYRALYHELNPHPGLSPIPDPGDPDTIAEQSENEAVYRRLLANGILAVLLPTEDLENSSLRALVVDVIADLILGNQVSSRACEGWFIWETIGKLAAQVGRRQTQDDTKSTPDSQINRLEKFGLLSTENELSGPSASFLATWIWNLLQKIYLGYVVLRFIAMGLFRVASSPGSSSHGVGVPLALPINQKRDEIESDGTIKRPVLDYRIYSMVSQILGIPGRMPWLIGLLALFQHLILAGPGRVGATDGIFDRFLRETIEEYVLTPTLLPNLLLATRTALFPSNTRPISQIAAGHIEAPASALQSVQTPTPSQKALAPTASPTPITEGARGPDTTDIIKANNPGNSSNGGKTATTATSGPSLSAIAADVPTPELNQPAEPVKRNTPSRTEIAAIKRRCAASLLALIPRSVTRTFLGVPPSAPPPYSGDGTCSSNSSPSLVTSPPSSPGAHHGAFQEGKANMASSHPPLPSDPCPVACGHLAAERLRTDDPSAGVDCEEVHLLDIIEHDFLDLFADEYCNKHLVWSIIETVVSKLLPEMTEHSVKDLLEDRGVAPVPPAFV